MSNAGSETAAGPSSSKLPWNPLWAVAFAIILFFVAQVVAGVLVSLYPALRHWSNQRANAWITNSVLAQFIFILLAEGLTLWGISAFLSRHKTKFSAIGLKKPRWVDPLFGLAAAPVYFIVSGVLIVISGQLTGLNVNQQQNIGFNSVNGGSQLILTFISLVILAPFTEEVLTRGFLYGSLKKLAGLWPAVLLTSLLFAAAHLQEGGSTGPFYVGALDTFILSLVLIFLREKTGSLWASITLHALKNGVAFVTIFLVHGH